MPSLDFHIKYRKNTDQVLSAQELREIYLFGTEISEQNRTSFPDETLNFYIQSAQQEIEHYLTLKLNKQIIEENRDYYREEWHEWGYVTTTYPVKKIHRLDGFIGTTRQVIYPVEWLSKYDTNEEDNLQRAINLVPNGSTGATENVVFSGVTPHIGFFGHNHIPQYWRVRYCTGFDNYPRDVLNAIGKMAAINYYHIAGDLIIGAGIASQSIGIDGLSQSISTTSSATNAGYGARIQGYLTDLKTSLPRMKDYYKGISFDAM